MIYPRGMTYEGYIVLTFTIKRKHVSDRATVTCHFESSRGLFYEINQVERITMGLIKNHWTVLSSFLVTQNRGEPGIRNGKLYAFCNNLQVARYCSQVMA